MTFWHKVFAYCARRNFFNWMSDKPYLKILFKGRMGYKLDLDNPRTFNEKLQWLKINDRRDEYTTMVDKYEVKQYVADKIGAEYIIPTIGVYDTFEEIDFDKLPNQFVIKSTHDSGGVVICKDKAKLDLSEAKRKINASLKKNYFWSGREWPYKNVKPRIIIEEYLEMNEGSDVLDYKVHCFNGIPEMILVCKDRFAPTGLTEDFYDTEWKHLDIARVKHGNSKTPIEKPELLDAMLLLSGKLAEGLPFSRIDFYEVNGKLFFGEITFFPATGMEKFVPETVDLQLGDRIDISKLKQ